jgi:hypothetical protein
MREEHRRRVLDVLEKRGVEFIENGRDEAAPALAWPLVLERRYIGPGSLCDGYR